MSASEIGQRAANGAEYAPNMPFERQKSRHLKYQPAPAASAVVVQTFPS